ncbi:MAG: non-homologous end-joining DNA ligase [Ilumatobacteraceae bacterium]
MGWPIAPMKASSGRFPSGDAWVFEPKWDGHRALVRISNGRIDAVSSTGQPRMERWPWMVELLDAIAADVDDIVLDGEAIAAGEDGKHSFQSVGRVDRNHSFVAFDILELNGRDLTRIPQWERRDVLTVSVKPTSAMMVTPVTNDGEALMTATKSIGFEGVIAKRKDSIYLPGKRTPNWIKIKHRTEQEFVIGGYLVGDGSRSTSFGSLLLGVHDGDELRFAGAVGTGFSDVALQQLRDRLQSRNSIACPFTPVPKIVTGKARWVVPDLVVQVAFTEWTEDAHLRHPVYLGLREDKKAADVVREC